MTAHSQAHETDILDKAEFRETKQKMERGEGMVRKAWRQYALGEGGGCFEKQGESAEGGG